MSFIERLGMAGVKTVKFDTGRGGIAELTGLDVVAALTGLPDHCVDYAQAVLVNSDSRKSIDRVIEYLSSKVITVSKQQAIGLAAIAISENTMSQCVACGGTGIQQNHADSLSMMLEALPCPHCKGLGRKAMKAKERAKLIGVHVNTYTNNKDVYEDVLLDIRAEINRIEMKINAHGKEKLG